MNQTMTEGVECIIVDDGGQDNSMEIVERIISEYDGSIEFRIFHHGHNRGLSAARNTGIDAAIGEYVYFLDSDDWIYNYCLESLFVMAKRYPKADFIQGTIRSENEMLNSWLHSNRHFPSDTDYIENKYRCRLLLQQTHHLPFMQNRLIRKRFIKEHNLTAKEGIVHEDNLWTFMAGKYVQSIAFCKNDTYYYRSSPEGIVSSVNKEVRAKGCSIVCDEITKNISMGKWFYKELSYVIWRIQSIEKLNYDNPFIFMTYANNFFIRKLYELDKNLILQKGSLQKRKIAVVKCIYCFLLYLFLISKRLNRYEVKKDI